MVQFAYIAIMRETFARVVLPVLSIDAKHREFVGDFKHPGAMWAKEPPWFSTTTSRADAVRGRPDQPRDGGGPWRGAGAVRRAQSDPEALVSHRVHLSDRA